MMESLKNGWTVQCSEGNGKKQVAVGDLMGSIFMGFGKSWCGDWTARLSVGMKQIHWRVLAFRSIFPARIDVQILSKTLDQLQPCGPGTIVP